MHNDATPALNLAVGRAKRYMANGYEFLQACRNASQEHSVDYEALCREMRDRSAMLRAVRTKARRVSLARDGKTLAAGDRP